MKFVKIVFVCSYLKEIQLTFKKLKLWKKNKEIYFEFTDYSIYLKINKAYIEEKEEINKSKSETKISTS